MDKSPLNKKKGEDAQLMWESSETSCHKTKAKAEISKEPQGLSSEKTCIPWEYTAQTRLKLSIIDRRLSSECKKVF